MRIIDGIYQLLTPFPQFSIADAKALRHELQEHPRVTKGLPYVLPYLIKDGDDTVLVDCGWNTDSAYQALEEGMKGGYFDFETTWTPGHSPGHICLYEPNRKILLTGDHVLPTITPNVSIHAQTHGSPLGDYMRSLELLEDLD